RLESTVRDFAAALGQASLGATATLVYLFPRSPSARAVASLAAALEVAAATIEMACAAIPTALAVDLDAIASRLDVRQIRDSFTDELGNIPFNEELFAAAATDAARRIRAIVARRRKVIVLDCDDTLWEGTCGEGDATVSPPFRYLQEFML